MDSSSPSPKILRPPPSAAIYITPPPNSDRLSPIVNLYRRSQSPSGSGGGGGSRPHSPLSCASGSRTPTPGNSRSGSPVPRSGSSASKHNHSIQDLVKLITKKVQGAGRKPKESLSPTPSPDARRTSCFLEVPKDASQFRSRSKSLDDGTTRKQPPSVDSATAYKIYDQILQEGRRPPFFIAVRARESCGLRDYSR
ncbi:hypothetical protein V9T40_008036 [Parthenolecanium corni]|uniref:Uncharacterized protein n=1 Tax=Parthenolecanium corni TaxID=536013 RepID=A0AAN9Y984_9HEMI